MNGADIIAIVILVAIIIAVLAYLLHWLYRRSTKDISFVRTGFGGEKVVMGGGAFVLPIIHDWTEVSMNTLRLEVQRVREKSLITKDRMRVELIVEFFVRVIPDAASVATAARTLGSRTMNSESLKELVQGRFVDAMGAVAASMTMEQMHEHRDTFIKAVKHEVGQTLTPNGLEIEAVSLTSLDQTDMKLFNPSNAFDAEGLTRLTEEIESRKKKRNDIEQDTAISIRKKNLEAEKLTLNLQRESEYARLAQESEVALRRAQQRAEVAQDGALRERQIEERRIKEREAVERARIELEQQIQLLEIQRDQARAIEEQQKEIALAQKAKERSEMLAVAEQARIKVVEAQEKSLTVRDMEIANRRKAVEILEAQQQAEREAIRLKVAAEAEKAAAKDRADADRIAVAALKERFAVEAEGKRWANEAENMRSDASRRSGLHQRLMENLPAIIRESVKPMEKISEIKIVQVEGLAGVTAGGNGGGGGGTPGNTVPPDGNLAEQVVSSALRYRTHAPFVDMMLGEIGMSGDSVHKIENLQNLSKLVYTQPDAVKPPLAPEEKPAQRKKDK
ncbi:flotillin family protein [Aestuariivirga sp.]|uniref:flotillin family protein n=1 Tax=Aestuariivirga sp. TaxID=2650926 RepID=UPI0039E45849